MDTTRKIGRYEILSELGHGAMGTVYRAKDPSMDRIVAVKTIISMMLASEQGSEFRERFYREARAAGALAHPGIVSIFDVGEHEGIPFLVMEFINGRTLADLLKKGGRMSLDRACEISLKIAEALGYAHQRGVVHRDIKPANILLTSREAHGIERPKITDFGVAKMAEGQTTLTGQILGTPAFMPPEQFTGAPVDGRADLFSLGVILYWMATGEQAFPGESMTAVSYKVVHTEPPPPRKLNPSISAKLEGVILKCLAKSVEDRYQTGEDLARDLRDLHGTVVVPGPRSAAQPAPFDPDATLIDPNATLIEPIRARPAEATIVPPAVEASGLKHKLDPRIVLAVAAAALILAAGSAWYALRTREPQGVRQTSSPLAPSPVPAPMPVPEGKSPADNGPKEAVKVAGTAAPKPARKPAPPAELERPVAKNPEARPIAPVAAEPAAVSFDPRSLDPKTNAKLTINADQVPLQLDFTVEMNGKVYLHRNAEGNKAEYDDLYVPPGVQEFRITAASGAVQKASNTVSLEFQPKKRNTMTIELRVQGMPAGSGIPQGLYPDTQLVVTLK